jgi:hypothetical protein
LRLISALVARDSLLVIRLAMVNWGYEKAGALLDEGNFGSSIKNADFFQRIL